METVTTKGISIVRACKVIDLDRSMYYYASVKDDSEVEAKLRWYAEHRPMRGFPKYYQWIRREGLIWNHKRIRRVYLKLGMSRRKKYKRRIPNPAKQALLQPLRPNLTWSIDFMHDTLENGRKFRTLNIIDDYNREALAIEVSYSFPAETVISKVKEVIEWRGTPEEIRSDNGTEFIAKAFEGFCSNSGIKHVKIQKGKPNQNGYIERFNRSFREEVLDANIFENLNQVKELTETFCEEYNTIYPHESLGNKTPLEFLKQRIKENV